MKLVLSLTFLALSILAAVFYDSVLQFFVGSLKSGWVFGSFYIRLIVIIFFTISLYLFFSLFQKTRKIKFVYVFLIALLPGFGVSFIKPIYTVDYGMFDDPIELDVDALSAATDGAFELNGQRTIITFFSTNCPHCMETSKRLGINQKAGQEVEVNAFFPGTPEATDKFIKANNGKDFNTYLIDNDSIFMVLGNYVFPSVYVVDAEGNTESHWSGELNYSAMDYIYELEP